jgi:hypothetical protein
MLAAANEQIDRLQARLSGLRSSVEKQGGKVQTLAVAVGSSFVFGNFTRDAIAAGRTLPTIGNMDPALTWGAGLYFLGPMIGGTAGAVAVDAGLGILCAFAFTKGNAPSRAP